VTNQVIINQLYNHTKTYTICSMISMNHSIITNFTDQMTQFGVGKPYFSSHVINKMQNWSII